MAAEMKVVRRMGVDAFVPKNGSKVPCCSHGPTILFERYIKGKSPRRYFACSASRDRKGCPFFQWEDEKVTTGRELMQKDFLAKLMEEKESIELMKKSREDAMQSKKNLIFCNQCSSIFIDFDQKHVGHQTKRISKKDLNEPSKFLLPAENKKTNAQYFFSESSCKFIISLLLKLGYERILSLGVPRIHEKIKSLNSAKSSKPESMLLDIDKRFAQFLPPNEFIHYNMFNNFFFGGEEDEKKVKDFMTGAKRGKLVLVMDPPFGGLMSILSESMKVLLNLSDNESSFDVKNVAIVMIFPYFLESHVTGSFPSLKMMDYKVCYENHPNFKEKASKRGSPIRIFTNLNGKDFSLPSSEGYWFCAVCEKYVAKENRHCERCTACTSKDGRTYKHCEQCGKCVKPDRIHCEVCKSCEQENHNCQIKVPNNHMCHICGETGHKRRECPRKIVQGLKRSAGSAEEIVSVKKKKTKKRFAKRQKK